MCPSSCPGACRSGTSHPLGPVHWEFDFCARSFYTRTLGRDTLTVVNLFPFATELQKWALRKPSTLPVVTEDDHTFDNPFCHHSSFLVWMFTAAVNDFAMFVAEQKEPTDGTWEISLGTMRHTAEVVLYSTRLAECLFKQLLYCTSLDTRLYFKAPLGQMLDGACRSCKGKAKHRVSLIGSLAHRYKMCGVYEQCIQTDLTFLNSVRNSQAAHATVGPVRLEPHVDRAWMTARHILDELGDRMIHLLGHVAEMETHLLAELEGRLHSEYPFGLYNSNLVSTYHWQQALLRLLAVLRQHALARSRLRR